MNKTPYISVIISAYNDLDLTKTLLTSLFKTRYRDFEVLVIDDCSPEDLSELKKLSQIRYLKNKKNLGVAITRNIAAQKARGEILLSLDNDVKPFGDLIKQVNLFFKKNPKIDAVTGFPGTGAENPSFFAKYKYLRDWCYWHLDVDPSRFYYFRPAVGAIKRKLFLELGGYDHRFCRPGMPAIEDLEFSYRLSKKGKIVFNPKMVVGHPFGGILKLSSTYFKRAALFLTVFQERHDFSGVATTTNEALTILLAVGVFGLLPFLIFLPILSFVWGIAFLFYFYQQRRFLSLCAKKEGRFFATGAFFISWYLYLVIFAGASYALLMILLGKVFKRALPKVN